MQLLLIIYYWCPRMVIRGYNKRCANQMARASSIVRFVNYVLVKSDHTLSHHGIGNLDEAGHVGTLHVVDVSVGTCTILHA